MAPEVYKGVPYNEKCDIYSFGLILWQCLELKQPFSTFTVKKMQTNVYMGMETPKISSKWSENLKNLLANSWSRDFSNRYDCEVVLAKLQQEILEVGGDEMTAWQLDISNCSSELSLP